MKLHILSDLHTEFHEFSPPEIDADVVVLAGDIGVGLDGIAWAAREFPELPVVYVPGNHEFYGYDIGFVDQLKATAHPSVHVLDNNTLDIDGVRFLGCTLWTDFKLNGEGEAWFAQQRAKRLIEDFDLIKTAKRRFRPEDSVELHETSRTWLADELKREFDGPTVVVTHHLPASMSVDRRYAGDPLNPAFASSLEDLIEQYQPDLWIHGHTHVACDYELFGTRIVCNPRGYPSESTGDSFAADLVVQI